MDHEMELAKKRVKKQEHIFGYANLMPFASNNSAPRRTMWSSQHAQIIPVFNPEIPLCQTGNETVYGQHSSSLVKSDKDYTVIEKISKYSKNPNHEYILVVESADGYYDVIERTHCKHITETYGYLYDNSVTDTYMPGRQIYKNHIIKKSNNYDIYGNRKDGVNLLTGYISKHRTTEDGMIISESAREKLTSPLIHNVSIIINDNDIPLNLYGDDNIYKAFPDIGEEVSDGILCAIRREKKEEMLYTLSSQNLKKLFMSDDKRIVHEGTVIGIDVACNSLDNLNNPYNEQLKYYHDCLSLYSAGIYNKLKPLVKTDPSKCSYDLLNLFRKHEKIHKGKPWCDNSNSKNTSQFSGTLVTFVIVEKNKITVADKIANRYGGKGVISEVVPDDQMPMLPDGRRLELIMNPSSPLRRNNSGGLFELSLNFLSSKVREKLKNKSVSSRERFSLLAKYIKLVCENMYEKQFKKFENMSDDILEKLLDEFVDKIYLSMEPVSETMGLARLENIYKEMSWIDMDHILTPQIGSDGKQRLVRSRRKIVCGETYIFRLKQYGQHQFSATSLTATNIKNEPTRNTKAVKEYKTPYSRSPIKWGEMEHGNFMHLQDIKVVVSNLLLHSASPQARKKVELLLTDDNPYEANISVDAKSRNRNVEIVNAYLKAIGLRLTFELIKVESIVPYILEPYNFTKEELDLINLKPFEELSEPNQIPYTMIKEDDKIVPYILIPKSENGFVPSGIEELKKKIESKKK